MTNKGKVIHPSIQQFKMFVKENPGLIKEVRNGNVTWQELYEEWYLLGEEDSKWDSYREGNQVSQKQEDTKEQEKSGEWMSKIINTVKNMDQEQLQGQIGNISQAIAAIQGVLSQFQGNQPSKPPAKRDAPQSPFSFRKD
ncbi:YlbD family protein [Mesobacillus maritimus]|uniref:YlbD family protein n=1 Tax=Mesobacillus maritimus TaxID=1643336 RepID=A0ABS7K665_9BACI|nr:YlbD family protein [Mesobacillus maritimus]MBY0097758.1 YlbD family protein [Mesobacillus maritimus]